MQGHLPPAAQEKYDEMQALQDEAEELVAEKQDAEERIADARSALTALEEADDGARLYQAVGTVRVETTADEARGSLEATVERLEAKVESLDEEKEELEAEFERRKEDIKHLLGGAGGDPTSPGTGN